MPIHYYYNSPGSKVSTNVQVNMCQKLGPMSFCRAFSIADQKGCKHREDASDTVHCMYWRDDLNGACDSVWAQRDVSNPNKEK